ncbi:uncharacterized protein LOC127877199 isoform X2 [Dreissena polymorpha]|uniref:uncharacterized protein LOC127877199 isoform X2 n=1 Tax=Dreissena polymorpha TaxID=45954 RepID=UPI00226518FA|nr:uncharacterized protein LOC127877199 isoform X2 [Dreissena polymorpha]
MEMSCHGDEQYEEIQQYLQQAQEDISRSFEVKPSAGFEGERAGHTEGLQKCEQISVKCEQVSVKCEQVSVKDIKPGKEVSQSSWSYPLTSSSKKYHTQSGSTSQIVGGCNCDKNNSLASTRNYCNRPPADYSSRTTSVTYQSGICNNFRGCYLASGNGAKEKLDTQTNDLNKTDKKLFNDLAYCLHELDNVLLSVGNELQVPSLKYECISRDIKGQLYDTDYNLSVRGSPTSTDNVDSSHGWLQHRETDSCNHMDDLQNCPSASLPLKNTSTAKPIFDVSQEVSVHLDATDIGSLNGSHKKVSSCRKSNISSNTQIDGRQLRYQRSGEGELDNRGGNYRINERRAEAHTRLPSGVSKVERIGDICDQSLRAGGDRADLEGFLQEINVSINELISSDKSEVCDSDKIEVYDNVSKKRERGNLVHRLRETENSGVSCGFKSDTLNGDSCSVENMQSVENVVETEEGYYWLSCTIEEECNPKSKEESRDKSDDVRKCSFTNESIDSRDFMGKNQDNDVSTSVEIKLTDFDCIWHTAGKKKPEQELVCRDITTDKDICKTCEDVPGNLFDGDKIRRSNCSQSSRSSGCSVKSDNLRVIQEDSVMTKSAPDGLSMGLSERLKQELETVSAGHTDKQPKRRKYSCPGNFFKIFRVVSIDIPHISTSPGDRKTKVSDKTSYSNEFDVFSSSRMLSKTKSFQTSSKSSLAVPKKELVRKNSLPSKLLSLPLISKCRSRTYESDISAKTSSITETEKAGTQINRCSVSDHWDVEDKAVTSNYTDTGVPDKEVQFFDNIISPPPGFISTGDGFTTGEQSHLASAPGTFPRDRSSREIALSEIPQTLTSPPPLTPPPPSPKRSENLICQTLLQYKNRKHSVDMISGVQFQKPTDPTRRKSMESGIHSEYADIDDFRGEEWSPDVPLCQKVISGQGRESLKGGNESCKSSRVVVNGSTHSTKELTNVLHLLNSYHPDNDASVPSAKTCDFQLCQESGGQTPCTNDDAIYATVYKKSKHKPPPPAPPEIEQNNNKMETLPDTPPKIPPKPKYFSESFAGKATKVCSDDHSPEFQIMFNSLSPVLVRRNSAKNRQNRRNGNALETSPESTPEVSPRDRVTGNSRHHDVKKNGQESSLFMDPKMAQTWHGATSANWSNIYGPQMRAMMRELNAMTTDAHDHQDIPAISNGELDDYSERSRTLPSRSLLDEMHKKFCADQYGMDKDAELARALVLFRLKSHPPVKPKRSQSFNIRMGMGSGHTRMGTGVSSSPASSESSPLIPRASERLRIKTRPDFQYSPKPGRPRAATPELLNIDAVAIQAENSRREEAEIEAIEACRWLRETGFPQYAQLYEDGQFPVDIDSVEKDHDFLDKEDIQSLFRRLNTLNKCAIMKIGTPTKKECEDSDDDDHQCALSDKWKYQRSSRRWSRKDLETSTSQPVQLTLLSASSHDSLLADQNSSSETGDSAQAGDSPVLDCKMHHTNSPDANGNMTIGINQKVNKKDTPKGAKGLLKRMESLKRTRSKKHKTITEISGPVITNSADMQAKIKHLNCQDIGSPGDWGKITSTQNVHVDKITSPRTEALTVLPSSLKTDLNLNTITMSSNSQTTLMSVHTNHLTSTPMLSAPSLSQTRALENGSVDDAFSLSSTNGALGLDTPLTLGRQSLGSDTTNSSEDNLFISGPGKFPTLLDDSLFVSDNSVRGRSFSYADDRKDVPVKRRSLDPRKHIHRVSIYDNVPVEEDLTTAQQELDIILSELFQNINGLNKAINGEDAELLEPPHLGKFDESSLVSSQCPTPETLSDRLGDDPLHEHDENEVISATLSSPDISDPELPAEETSHDDSAEHILVRDRRDSGVGSSLTRSNSERRRYRIRWHSFQKSHRPTSENRNLQIASLTARQILVLRKLLLLKLTALIEKHAPNRSGWSMTVPRFMKRNKGSDFKDKHVFGVPFSVMIQRTGQALPQCILHAMRYLRRTSGDAVGIFRKSGVRVRIQKLRNDLEANPESVDFEEMQAYDVADLVKLYFRELPECLLTNKLSEIFTSIFIYVPSDQRLEALQAAVVLMADENRDVLQSLLLFLSDISKHANRHQMTASNLAVCFAPSLFNMGGPRSASQTPSPRRNRKNPGIPDPRELMEQTAAHQCLTLMIQECKKLFTISTSTLSKCRVLCEDPVSLEELNSRVGDGDKNGYAAHIDACIQGLLKESREKFRGWVGYPTGLDVDVAYKKVGDGHPLRLWKCTADIEAPPAEVLNRILHDRQQWDEDLLQWSTLEKLDQQTEVFQYERNSLAPHPTRDFCVLSLCSCQSVLPD